MLRLSVLASTSGLHAGSRSLRAAVCGVWAQQPCPARGTLTTVCQLTCKLDAVVPPAWHQSPRQNQACRPTSTPAAATEAASTSPADEPEGAEGGDDGLGPTCVRCTVTAVGGEEAELLSDLLLGLGAQSVVVQEHRNPGSQEQEIFDDGHAQLWDCCDVVAYFPVDEDIDSALASAAEALERSAPFTFHLQPVLNESWVDQIKASYVPLQITQDLWIIPEWSEPTDPAAVNVILQPGVAFGTGEHPTTRLCLQHLRSLDLKGLSVMDYGAGSGVLALAALKLGAIHAVGTDVDRLAVKAAARNAELNGLSDRLQVYQCGSDMDAPEALEQAGVPADDRLFDLVVANILRGPLVELRTRLTGYLRPGGQLVLSGVLEEQAREIALAYSVDFEDFKVQTEGTWAMLTAVRKRI